jgi:serine phosphatase RsbU (regulator of sigma subunit)
LLIIIGVIDFITGYELSFQFFYLIPLTLVALNVKFKKRYLIFFAVLAAIIWFLADYLSSHVYSNEFLYFWNTFSRLIVYIIFTLFLNSLTKYRIQNELDFELSKKNFLINESIKYAKTIQDSLIPPFKEFKTFFPASFILSKPKDILSGDFFWYSKTKNNVFFAIIDCTGHGIPGSLLSVIGNILLERIVIGKNIILPNEILKNLHEELVRVFSAGMVESDDGMEICLIQFDESKNEITVSQTSQSAIIIYPDGLIKELECNGYTIGGILSKRNGAFYTSETIKIEKGTWLYLFSDGYIDQFGTKENIKFGINNFTNLLKDVNHLTSNEQLEIFSNTIEKWKGDFKQTDDITVVGIGF